jgi:hypothetical protein
MYGVVLLIVIVVICIYTFSCMFEVDIKRATGMKIPNVLTGHTSDLTNAVDDDAETQPFSQYGNNNGGYDNEFAELEHGANVYDPISMGAIKPKEVDAHNNNLRDRSPFSTVGTMGSSRVRRDDDPYTRDTGGVPWVGGVPIRAFRSHVKGVGDHGRESGSTSDKSLHSLHQVASSVTAWNS